MTEIKHRERILEAIDQLRRRKARPDAERICNFLLRRFAVDSQDTIADLERLVEEDVVVKVEYKGNISYRNAAKWSRYAVYNRTGGPMNSEGTSSLLSSAVAELIIQEPDYLDFGVPGPELERYIQEKDSTRFTKRYLEVILQRELNSGNIVKLENGNFSLADHPVPPVSNPTTTSAGSETIKMLKMDSPHVSEEEEDCTPAPVHSQPRELYFEIKKDAAEMSGPGSASSESLRDAGKRKRSKKVFFDPSDVHVPTRKRGRPLGSTNKNKALNKLVTSIPPVQPKVEPDRGSCYVCSGRADDLLCCKHCSNKVHSSCIDESARSGSQWQCMQCKTCVVCMETGDKETLLPCRACGEPYHLACHEPKLPDDCQDFVCSQCIPSPNKPICETRIDETIPDVSMWSVEQVCKYLEEQGFPVQAAVFRDNDIDGASLLLMKRSDVLVGLQLKLGPALKVYGQVKKLQLRQSDITLLWP